MTPYHDAIFKLGLSLKPGLRYDIDVRHDDDCAAVAAIISPGDVAVDFCSCEPGIAATAYVRAHVRTIDGQLYAVIEVCPFCGARHTHSPEPGHRWAHCADHPGKPSNSYILEFHR